MHSNCARFYRFVCHPARTATSTLLLARNAGISLRFFVRVLEFKTFSDSGRGHYGVGAFTRRFSLPLAFGSRSFTNSPTSDEKAEEQYAWSSPEALAALSRECYGEALATRVASRLTTLPYDSLSYSHQFYCGHGLFYLDGIFELRVVDDNELDCKKILGWSTRELFVTWLARQSDYSLCGADPDADVPLETSSWKLNNQRITRSRCIDFCEESRV